MAASALAGPSQPAMAASALAGPSQPAMAALQWRQFTFFDLEEVKDAEDLAQSPKAVRDLRPPVVVTATSPQSPLVPSLILSSATDIAILDRHFNPTRTFKAWDNQGRGTALLEAGGLLVGVGEEEGSRYPVLKIWDLTRDERKKAGGGPVLVRNVRIQHGQRPHPVGNFVHDVSEAKLTLCQVSSVALTSNLSHLAIGLGDGTVLLYRHLPQSLTTAPASLTSLPKARVIHESPEPITGLGFREPPVASTSSTSRAPEAEKLNVGQLSLFIVTTNRVLCALVSGKGGEARTIDELGCGLGCAVMDWERRDMVIARDEAIYLYGPEGRGACYAYEGMHARLAYYLFANRIWTSGPKSSIAIYRHNLIIVSPPFFPSAGSTSATVRHYVSKTAGNGSDGSAVGASDIAKVTIFDLQNKLIAYSGTFRDGVREVSFQWGELFVFGANSKLSRLDQHSTAAKLEVLYRRNLYTLAISLARAQGIGEAGVADIHRRYGDYLYGKGDFDGAMGQFVKTLGYLQPSYVIRNFLDAQRIHNLTTYLQELHSRGLANQDHTTLLLNCYTKTSDRARLDTFIKSEAKRSDESGGGLEDLPFDLETAIRVCRQAGFFEHATYLAHKYGRHEEYLRIQIEDAEQYEDALRYLRSLGPTACEENMILYGKTLLQHEPQATTGLLVDLCSGNLGKNSIVPDSAPDDTKVVNGTSGPAMLSYLGYDRVQGLFNREEQSLTSAGPSAPISPGAAPSQTGEQTSQGQTRGPPTDGVDGSTIDGLIQDDGPLYTPPSPRLFFAHFVDHHDFFVRFLESVALNLWNQKVDSAPPTRTSPLPIRDIESGSSDDSTIINQRAVWNTLLELYLASTRSLDYDVSSRAHDKALGLLAQGTEIPYDPMHALILCSTIGFTDGLVGIWESMGMYEDVLRYYMENDKSTANGVNGHPDDARSPSDEVLRYLNLYGPTNPHLYPLVLRYLTSSPEILSRHPTQLGKLLDTIDAEHIMPTLAVVQLLSRNGVASVGSVKEWLRAKVAETRQVVEADRSLVQSYRSETAAKQKELSDLANPRQPEVFQVTRCAACGSQLDLPSVHFMCKHSYHQRCLSDSEPECILCARQHSIIREVRRNQTRLADRHDLFLSEVHEADDGFGVVAGAFGRGLMGNMQTGAA